MLKDQSGSLITCPNEIANILNHYFCTVANESRKNLSEDKTNMNMNFDHYKYSYQKLMFTIESHFFPSDF